MIMRCVSTRLPEERQVAQRHEWRQEVGWTLKENKRVSSIYHEPWNQVAGASHTRMTVAVGGRPLSLSPYYTISGMYLLTYTPRLDSAALHTTKHKLTAYLIRPRVRSYGGVSWNGNTVWSHFLQ